MNLVDTCKDKRVLQISHNDGDGFGATVLGFYYIQPVAFSFYTENTDDYDLQNYNLEKIINGYDIFLFTDFSPTKRVIDILRKYQKAFYCYDHHISAFDELSNIAQEEYVFNNEKCGTLIFFEALTKGKRIKKVVAQFVELINIYDLYQMNSALWHDAKGLCNVLWGYTSWFSGETSTGKSMKFITAMLYKFDNDKYFSFNSYEQGLIRRAEQKEKENYEIAKKSLKKRTDNSGNLYGYFECISKLSIVANYILTDNQDLRYVIAHSTYEDKGGHVRPKISIRSTDDRCIDCSQIAKIYNGGGHKESSGIEFTDMSFFEKLRSGKVHLF